MNKELKNKWISALRSEAYSQAKYRLRSTSHGDVSYCCLGVLCCVSGKFHPMSPVFGAKSLMSGKALDLVDGSKELNDKLAKMNDDYDLSFAEIADWVEANVPAA
jgi:hypothetical protein